MTRALRMVIDDRSYWFVDDLHESHVPERHRSMCVMQERGVCEIVEVDIVVRDTERRGAPDDVVTLVENLKPEAEAGL